MFMPLHSWDRPEFCSIRAVPARDTRCRIDSEPKSRQPAAMSIARIRSVAVSGIEAVVVEGAWPSTA